MDPSATQWSGLEDTDRRERVCKCYERLVDETRSETSISRRVRAVSKTRVPRGARVLRLSATSPVTPFPDTRALSPRMGVPLLREPPLLGVQNKGEFYDTEHQKTGEEEKEKSRRNVSSSCYGSPRAQLSEDYNKIVYRHVRRVHAATKKRTLQVRTYPISLVRTHRLSSGIYPLRSER